MAVVFFFEVNMGNAWKVLVVQEGKRKFREFEGDMPRSSGALDFAKKAQDRGLTILGIISTRKGFDRPPKRVVPRGQLWCPYCLKSREFVERGFHSKGIHAPVAWRCPVCFISIRDAHVRRNNPDMVAILDARARPQVPSTKMIRKAVGRGR